MSASIKYENSKFDIFTYQLISLSKNRVLQSMFFIVFVFIFYNEYVASKLLTSDPKIGVVLALITAVIYMLVGVMFWLVMLIVFVYTKKYAGCVGEHTLTLDPNGIQESTQFNEAKFGWNGCINIRSTKSYLVIYVSEGVGYIIPKNRKSTTGDLKEFESMLIEYIGRNRQ